MKRKYAAMILGMALAVSSISVCAESVDTAADAAVEQMTEDASMAEDAGTEYYGEITEIGEDTITITVGMPMENAAETAGDETLAGVEASVSAEEASDAEDTADVQDDADTQDAADTKEAADVQDSEDTENTADAEADAQNGLDAADTKPAGILLEFTGEERAVTITEDTLLLREEQPEELADEGAEADAAAEVSDEAAEADAAAEVSEEDAETDTDAEAADVDAEPAEEANAAEPEVSEIAFEDLMVGDIVKINFDEDGAAAAVTVVTPADMNTLENAITVELAEEDADAAEAGTESVIEAE